MPGISDAELFHQLHSVSPHERLSAAREFGRRLSPSDLPILETALAVEQTAFVKTALRNAIERLKHPAVPRDKDREELPNDDVREVAEWKARKEVTGTLLHEILPRLGSIEYEALRAVEGYQGSRLASKIESLKDLMTAMQQLQEVTHPRSPVDFLLYDVLTTCVADEEAEGLVRFEGDKQLSVIGDPNLVKLAFCNGLRNAMEATSQMPERQIVVTWGQSDVQYCVRVIDNGPGLRGAAQAAMKIGRTTKSGHTGFGLSIANAALMSLDGEVALEANNPSGVIFSMKWYRP